MTQSEGTWRKTSVLAIGGGLGFWVCKFKTEVQHLRRDRVVPRRPFRATKATRWSPWSLSSRSPAVIGCGDPVDVMRFAWVY